MCCAPQPSIVNSTDRVVDCCFYRFVSFLSGSFQEFLSFHADCVEGDSLVALLTADFVLYRTATPWGCVRRTQHPFCAMEEDPANRLVEVMNCSSAPPWVYMQEALQFAGAKRRQSSSRAPGFQ
ncbi:hypothetical protein TcCL_ESM07385 [Trypanosoma cruzi]|nr:hypothetical protein TcCL_ESM07385 [Trypanosoma cruzi]